jgi:glycosyltransferase involved in cell wall biosynthesis
VWAIGDFDIAVLPGTLPTGAPMKLVEYAAMARPIVAPDLPNLRECFVPGVEIRLVPPGDAVALAQAIRDLCANPHRAREMGRAAQERVRSLTWEQLAGQILRRVREAGPASPAQGPIGSR